MNPFTVHLSRSRRLADVYDVPDWVLDGSRVDISGTPDKYRHVLEAQTLAGAVLATAEVHKSGCERFGCDTCAALRDAVALAALVIQTEAGRDLGLLPGR
ncbi:hypothetical protein [Actinoplanes sp. NPDC023714]|uniref:hypothetical protein n=1 Tax=Actinoplanes sp. NPDC023714 TaxID=3154322 RepID=UPI0033D6BC22